MSYEKISSTSSPENNEMVNLEKTPFQKDMINMSCEIIADRLDQIGVAIPRPDESKIIYKHLPGIGSALNLISGEVEIEVNEEMNLSLNIHELLHFYSKKQDGRSLENSAKTRLKSGFNSVQYQYMEGTHIIGNTNFSVINEGITDKITHELVVENMGKLAELKQKYGVEKIEKRIQEIMEKYILECTILKIKDDEYYQKEKDELEIAIKEIKSERLLYGETPDDIDRYISDKRESIQNHINVYKEVIDVKKSRLRDEMIWKTKELRTMMEFTPQPPNYLREVELVEIIIGGIAQKLKTENDTMDLDELKKEVWSDLQHAYFTGNVFYLRVIEKVFGKETLKKLSGLDSYDQDGIDNEIQRLKSIFNK